MFFGRLSVIRLRATIDGYIYGIERLAGDATALRTEMAGFEEFVLRREHIQAPLPWERTLEFVGNSDEAGLELFWKRWDEYVVQRTGHPPRWDPDLYKGQKVTVGDGSKQSNVSPIGQGVLDLIAEVRRDTVALLGYRSIHRFRHFMYGSAHAYWKVTGGSDSTWAMGNFQEYVQDEYSIVLSLGWCSILDFFAGGDAEGLDLFLKEWDAYLLERENNPTRFEEDYSDLGSRILDRREPEEEEL